MNIYGSARAVAAADGLPTRGANEAGARGAVTQRAEAAAFDRCGAAAIVSDTEIPPLRSDVLRKGQAYRQSVSDLLNPPRTPYPAARR